MRGRTVTAFVIAALVLAAGAVASIAFAPDYAPPERAGETVFPDLLGRADSLSAMLIERPEGRLTLQRTDTGWAVAEVGGYPAATATVRRTLMALAELALLEPKTRQPDRHGKLGLLDPRGAESKGGGTGFATALTLLDEDGSVIAEALLGRVRADIGREPGTYLRLPGDDQAWLARGVVDLPPSPAGWLDHPLARIEPDRVASVEVVRPDGKRVAITRRDGGGWSLNGADGGLAAKLAALAENLTFSAVRRDAPQGRPDAIAELATRDGVWLTIKAYREGDGAWMRLSARAREGGPGTRREAAAIDARTEGWTYRMTPQTEHLLLGPPR